MVIWFFLLERGRQESMLAKSQLWRSSARVSTFEAGIGGYWPKHLFKMSRSKFFQFLFRVLWKEGFNVDGRIKLNLIIKWSDQHMGTAGTQWMWERLEKIGSRRCPATWVGPEFTKLTLHYWGTLAITLGTYVTTYLTVSFEALQKLYPKVRLLQGV